MAKDVCIVNNECLKADYPVGATISIEGVNCKVVEDIDHPEECAAYIKQVQGARRLLIK